jgi:hypothetical protein
METLARLADKMYGEFEDIFAALSQGRTFYWKYPQTIEQIETKVTYRHLLAKVAVGCCDHSDVYLSASVLPNPFKLAFVERA